MVLKFLLNFFMRKGSFLLILIFLLHGCASTPQRSNAFYSDPADLSTGSICNKLETAILASAYRQSLWRAEIKKRNVICTGGFSYYQIPQNNYDELYYDIAISQKASNERGETCTKYDSQYWVCEDGYELEWNKSNCLYECFLKNASSPLSGSENEKVTKPGGPPRE